MERYSRQLAQRYFEESGWTVMEMPAVHPFDLLCRRGDDRLDVEVKSTKGPGAAVLMTYGEVDHHREAPLSALFLVHSVQVRTNAEGQHEAFGESTGRTPMEPRRTRPPGDAVSLRRPDGH